MTQDVTNEINNNQSEEVNNSVVNNETENTELSNESNTSESPQYNDVEKRAMKRGWVPREKLGDDRTFRSAKDFLDFGELGDKIKSLNDHNKNLENELNNVATIIKKREKFAYEEAIKTLGQQRREAIENGDVSGVDQLDEKINLHKKYSSEIEETKKPYEPKAEVKQWLEQRTTSWLNNKIPENVEMMQEARFFEESYLLKNPSDEIGALNYAEERIKKIYPHRFNETPRNRKEEVAGGESSNAGRSAATTKYKYDRSKVTASLTQMAQQWVKRGVFKSVEEYYEAMEKSENAR